MAMRPSPDAPPTGLGRDGAEWQVIHIEVAAPPKPAFGAPCNGCGVCCLYQPCPLGMVLSRRRSGACMALRWDDAQAVYRCGAIFAPLSVLPRRWRWAAPWLAHLARRWIAAGKGCDSTLETSTPAPLRKDQLNG